MGADKMTLTILEGFVRGLSKGIQGSRDRDFQERQFQLKEKELALRTELAEAKSDSDIVKSQLNMDKFILQSQNETLKMKAQNSDMFAKLQGLALTGRKVVVQESAETRKIQGLISTNQAKITRINRRLERSSIKPGLQQSLEKEKQVLQDQIDRGQLKLQGQEVGGINQPPITKPTREQQLARSFKQQVANSVDGVEINLVWNKIKKSGLDKSQITALAKMIADKEKTFITTTPRIPGSPTIGGGQAAQGSQPVDEAAQEFEELEKSFGTGSPGKVLPLDF